MLDLSGENDRKVHVLTLSSTVDELTEVKLPQWIRRIIVRPRTNDAKLAWEGTDGGTIGTTYKTVEADVDRLFQLRWDGPEPPDWPPVLYFASGTASTVLEIELEG